MQMVRYRRTGSRAGRVTSADELTEIEGAAGRWSGSMGTGLVTLFACGDVMPGRGIDQILP